MESSSRASTTPAQSHKLPTLSASGADTSPELRHYYYPSPTQERAPHGAAKHNTTKMAAPSPVNGPGAMAYGSSSGSVSPRTATVPKTVTFELLVTESPQSRARLPLRVSIFPHDDTESIVTTVRNFYGLYSGPGVSKGVSFEDDKGNTLIARYENFSDQMNVSVRVIEEVSPVPAAFGSHPYHSPPVGPQSYYSDNYSMAAPQHFGQRVSRPASRTSRVRSPSPNGGRGRRSTSAGTASKKGRSRSAKNRIPGAQANGDGLGDMANGYSSGDGAPGSASGKNKDHLGNTEISVENIVEGGRRKRAKFESSELPLFAPPQMPAATSNSSISPARRIEHHRNSLPFVHPAQNPFSNPRPLQSPQSYTHGYAHTNMYATPGFDARRTRGSFGYPPSNGVGPGMGMMPTPDPTVGSCMSEEDKDVAMQLMRLGEMSNISQGRTSASTLDDTFSGRADAASSTGATSDAESESEEEAPPPRRQKLDASGSHKKILNTTESHFIPPQESVEANGDDANHGENAAQGTMAAPRIKSPKPKSSSVNGSRPRTQSLNKIRTTKPSKPKVKKASSATGPMSPASLPVSRKPSVSSIVAPALTSQASPMAPGEDEQPDLSTKPRCQRCRKSKKGCDRQRPCGRCKDAGLSAEACISEDEGNGRKGRYGRHMGVPIAIAKDEVLAPNSLLPAAPIATASETSVPISGMLDKNKKRKR